MAFGPRPKYKEDRNQASRQSKPKRSEATPVNERKSSGRGEQGDCPEAPGRDVKAVVKT